MSTRAKLQTVESHRRKIQMARKMMAKGDIVGKKSIWDTDRWNDHVKAVKLRVRNAEQRDNRV